MHDYDTQGSADPSHGFLSDIQSNHSLDTPIEGPVPQPTYIDHFGEHALAARDSPPAGLELADPTKPLPAGAPKATGVLLERLEEAISKNQQVIDYILLKLGGREPAGVDTHQSDVVPSQPGAPAVSNAYENEAKQAESPSATADAPTWSEQLEKLQEKQLDEGKMSVDDFYRAAMDAAALDHEGMKTILQNFRV